MGFKILILINELFNQTKFIINKYLNPKVIDDFLNYVWQKKGREKNVSSTYLHQLHKTQFIILVLLSIPENPIINFKQNSKIYDQIRILTFLLEGNWLF